MEVFTHPVYIFIHLLIKTNILGGCVCVCVGGGGGGGGALLVLVGAEKGDGSHAAV